MTIKLTTFNCKACFKLVVCQSHWLTCQSQSWHQWSVMSIINQLSSFVTVGCRCHGHPCQLSGAVYWRVVWLFTNMCVLPCRSRRQICVVLAILLWFNLPSRWDRRRWPITAGAEQVHQRNCKASSTTRCPGFARQLLSCQIGRWEVGNQTCILTDK